MENPIAAPAEYTESQEHLFYGTILPVLELLRKGASDEANRAGFAGVSRCQDNGQRLLTLIDTVASYAEEEFGLYIADDALMHEIDSTVPVGKEGFDGYYLMFDEDEARLFMMEDGCDVYSYDDLPDLTEENCPYYPFITHEG